MDRITKDNEQHGGPSYAQSITDLATQSLANQSALKDNGTEHDAVKVDEIANQADLNKEIQNQGVVFLEAEEGAGMCTTCVVAVINACVCEQVQVLVQVQVLAVG
jgi:hypothetical protein